MVLCKHMLRIQWRQRRRAFNLSQALERASWSISGKGMSTARRHGIESILCSELCVSMYSEKRRRTDDAQKYYKYKQEEKKNKAEFL